MADGHKQLATELIAAIQNKTLDGFIGFNYEGVINQEYENKLNEDSKRLQQLIEMLEKLNKKWGNLNTNIFILRSLIFYLY